jgi:hypothetical protein
MAPAARGDVPARHLSKRDLHRLQAGTALMEHRRRTPGHVLVGRRAGSFAPLRSASRLGGRRTLASSRRDTARRRSLLGGPALAGATGGEDGSGAGQRAGGSLSASRARCAWACIAFVGRDPK